MKSTYLILDVTGKPVKFIYDSEWYADTTEQPKLISVYSGVSEIMDTFLNSSFNKSIERGFTPDRLGHNICRIIPNDELVEIREVEVNFATNEMTVKNVWLIHAIHGDGNTKPKLRVVKDHVVLVDL